MLDVCWHQGWSRKFAKDQPLFLHQANRGQGRPKHERPRAKNICVAVLPRLPSQRGGGGGVEGGAHRTVIEKVHGYRGDNRLGSRGAKRASVT